MTVKIELEKFKGVGASVKIFLDDFERLCTHEKICTDVEKINLLPLYLEGDAKIWLQFQAPVDSKKWTEVKI